MNRQIFYRPSARRALASAVVFALALAALPVAPASARGRQMSQGAAKLQRLTEGQRIAHTLNRLGFGPRPGDVERVRRMGLDAYVEQQLRPEKIDDAAAEAKLGGLPTLRMTTAELYAKYPQPGQLVRQLQRDGKLPADLAEQYANRTKAGGGDAAAATKAGADAKTPGGEMAAGGDAAAMMTPPRQPGAAPANGGGANREYRQAIQDYYREHGLLQPQRITVELQSSRILRAVYSERQLQESLVDFWTNHFNVFAGKGADRWLLVAYDRDTIRPNSLGKFKDLLTATAQSPAMLFYLDNFQSVSPNGGPNRARAGMGGAANERRPRVKRLGGQLAAAQIDGGGDTQMQNGRVQDEGMGRRRRQQQRPAQPRRQRRGINENYARELMELHTLGVDGGYTQKDVQEVARCFTGWTIFDARGAGAMSGLTDAGRAGTFNFNPRLHDDGEKIVLGHKIPAGGGVNDGLTVLDILSKHPATAKFVATKLARRFADSPPPALVERVAKAFTKSDGDIRETMRALIASPEFNSPEAYRAKIKTPFELAASAVRALGGDTNGGPGLHQWIARMGEPLYMYQAPTGYPDTAEHWVNTGALLERINFALALVSNRIPGTRVQLAGLAGNAARAAADKSRVIDEMAAVILQGDLSAKTKQSLLKQLGEASTGAGDMMKSDTAEGADATAAAQANGKARPGATTGGAQSVADDLSDDSPPRRGGRRAMMMMGAAGNGGNNNAPVTETARVAALILGSPEFQRQ
jgi:uncharacterized protein (DUF1800 family)